MPATDAQKLFQAQSTWLRREERMCEALLTMCGLDPRAHDTWPLNDVTFDHYDLSFEFQDVLVGWCPTMAQLNACFALGFHQCWICYLDGTERHCVPGCIGYLKLP